MATRELHRHLDRLERTAFDPIRRRSGGRIDYEFYAQRARRERARAWRRGLHGLGSALRRGVLEPVRRRRQVRATYRELMALDDRMLADIGLRRTDIPAVAHGAWTPAAPAGGGHERTKGKAARRPAAARELAAAA